MSESPDSSSSDAADEILRRLNMDFLPREGLPDMKNLLIAEVLVEQGRQAEMDPDILQYLLANPEIREMIKGIIHPPEDLQVFTP